MEILWITLFLWVVIGYIVGPTTITAWKRYYLNYSEESLRSVDFETGFELFLAIVLWPIVLCVYGTNLYAMTDFAKKRRASRKDRPNRTYLFAFSVWLSEKLRGKFKNRDRLYR